MNIRFAFLSRYDTAHLALASSLDMDVIFSGTAYTGMTIHPFTLSLNERTLQHSETYPKYLSWENFLLWMT